MKKRKRSQDDQGGVSSRKKDSKSRPASILPVRVPLVDVSAVTYLAGAVYGCSVPMNVLGEWRCGQCSRLNVFKRKQCALW